MKNYNKDKPGNQDVSIYKSYMNTNHLLSYNYFQEKLYIDDLIMYKFILISNMNHNNITVCI